MVEYGGSSPLLTKEVVLVIVIVLVIAQVTSVSWATRQYIHRRGQYRLRGEASADLMDHVHTITHVSAAPADNVSRRADAQKESIIYRVDERFLGVTVTTNIIKVTVAVVISFKN